MRRSACGAAGRSSDLLVGRSQGEQATTTAMSEIRRLFVTGASTGLGQGLADHYARAGAHLGLVARRESLLRELEKEWTGRGARVEVYAGDVADTDFMAHSAQT